MSVWDTYETRLGGDPVTKRGIHLRREVATLRRKLGESLSYHEAVIDGETQNVAIINSDNLNEKSIISLPGDDIKAGAMVDWMDEHWIVTERDANTTVYTKCKMMQCNYLLKWIDEDGTACEQWCIVEDGTKLRILVSAQRNLCTKRPIELLGTLKAVCATALHGNMRARMRRKKKETNR